MALIVEIGQAAPDAESYLSVANADTYHDKNGNPAWADLDTPDKEIALRRATQYLTRIYRGKWKGYRTTVEQALDWPRVGVNRPDVAIGYNVPQDHVPAEVLIATADLALKSLAGPLLPDLERAVIQEQVGPLTVTYDRASPEQTRFQDVDATLRPLLAVSGPMIALVR